VFKLNDRVSHCVHGFGTVECDGIVYDDKVQYPPGWVLGTDETPIPVCFVRFDDGQLVKFRGNQQYQLTEAS
jgi:hypothetical protein